LANQFFDSRKRVVSRRRKDCAGYAAAKQYITMRNDRFFEPLPRLRDIRNSSFHLSPHCREALLVDGEEKILLRWKVIVERSGQNAGRRRDVAYRSALKSFARKQLRCSGDNLLSTVRSLSRLFGLLSTTFDCDPSRHCSSFNNQGYVLELDNSHCFRKLPKPESANSVDFCPRTLSKVIECHWEAPPDLQPDRGAGLARKIAQDPSH
jgi:hypothetical protein